MKVSKVFILSFSIIAALIIAAVFLLTESYTSQNLQPEAQAQSLVNRFRTSTAPVERLVTLAGLFKLSGNKELAQRLFYAELSHVERRALFELEDPQVVGSELITVIKGVYTAPRLVNDENNNALLIAMALQLSQLENVQGQDPLGLHLEITRWVGGRQYYLSNSQYQEALRAYDVAITMNDRNPGTYYDRAMTYAALGDHKQSVYDLAQVVTMDPDWFDLVRQQLDADHQLYSTWFNEPEISSVLDELVSSTDNQRPSDNSFIPKPTPISTTETLTTSLVLADTIPKSVSAVAPTTSPPTSTTTSTTFPATSTITTATVPPPKSTSFTTVSQPTVAFTPVSLTCPSATVLVSSGQFCLNAHEVTNAAYQECVESGECASPAFSRSLTRKNYFDSPDFEEFPVIHVTWNDAQTYCKYVGMELPQADQWEQAQRSLASSTISTRDEDTRQVKSFAADKSSDGVYDLVGNVKEWVADSDGIAKLVKGESFSSLPSDPKSYLPDQTAWDIGFRCAVAPN